MARGLSSIPHHTDTLNGILAFVVLLKALPELDQEYDMHASCSRWGDLAEVDGLWVYCSCKC